MVHEDGRSVEPTLVEWILVNYPDIADVGEPTFLQDGSQIERPGIVHRIDKDTSGVLIIAKTIDAFVDLKSQFAERQIEKQYAAFVYGNVKENYDVINRPIGKSKKDPRMWSAQRGARGQMREAITEYRVRVRGKDASYIEVRPKTGRTHQIRVHMKAINHPVVGDALYAPKMEPLFGFKRHALHAEQITFKDLSGTPITVKAPFPPDFVKAEKEIKKQG